MSDRQRFQLSTDTARQNASNAVNNAPQNYIVEIKPRTRSLDQNAMLHALFSDVSKQATLHGRRLTPIQWKTVFISAHATATGLGSDMVPGLEGEFVNIRESSARMSVSRMTSLIEYILAWCADNGIVTAPEEQYAA